MNDDELSAFLLGEVPEPGADFFDKLSGRLHEMEDGTNENIEKKLEFVVGEAPSSAAPTQTPEDAVILDLSSARERRTRRWGSIKALGSVAAALVPIVIGWTAFDRLNDGGELETAASVGETSETTVDPAQTEEDAPAGSSTVADESTSEDPDPDVAILPDEELTWWTPQGTAEARTTPNTDTVSQTFPDRHLALQSTGARVTVQGEELVEIQGFDYVDGPAWIPVEQLEPLGPGLPATSPTTVQPAASGPVTVFAIPRQSDSEILTTLSADEQIAATGRRAQVDDVEWSEVLTADGRLAWVITESIIVVQTGEQRQCFSNDTDLVLIDSGTLQGEGFTGALARDELFFVLEATRVSGQTDPTRFDVRVTPIGEAVDQSTTEIEIWTAETDRLTTDNGSAYTPFTCDNLSERFQRIDAAVAAHEAQLATPDDASG